MAGGGSLVTWYVRFINAYPYKHVYVVECVFFQRLKAKWDMEKVESDLFPGKKRCLIRGAVGGTLLGKASTPNLCITVVFPMPNP